MKFEYRDRRGKSHLVEIVSVDASWSYVSFRWSCDTLGFGSIEFSFDKKEGWKVETEYMGEAFAKAMLLCWFENCKKIN